MKDTDSYAFKIIIKNQREEDRGTFNHMNRKLLQRLIMTLTVIITPMFIGCGDENELNSPQVPDSDPVLSAPEGAIIRSSFDSNFTSDEGFQVGDEIQITVNKFIMTYKGMDFTPLDYYLKIGDVVLPTQVTTRNALLVLTAFANGIKTGKNRVDVVGHFNIPGYGEFDYVCPGIMVNIYKSKPLYDVRISPNSIVHLKEDFPDEQGNLVTKESFDFINLPYNYPVTENIQDDTVILKYIKSSTGKYFASYNIVGVSNFDAKFTITGQKIGNRYEPTCFSNYLLFKEEAEAKSFFAAKEMTVTYTVSGICEGQQLEMKRARTFKIKFVESTNEK